MTKQELLDSIEEVLSSSTSIKHHIERVYDLRVQLEKQNLLTHEERLWLMSKIKGRVQWEAENTYVSQGCWGAILAATGAGKSKIAINHSKSLVDKFSTAKILLSVPTEKLRDETWHDEFKKWGLGHIWDNNIERTCYASLDKFEGQEYDFVILDEGHNITPNNAIFFKKNKVKSVMLLTATRPRDADKVDTLISLGIRPIYEITLDDCVKLGLIAPYDVTVITMKLDSLIKYIEVGREGKKFKITEASNYAYLTKKIEAAPIKLHYLQRMRFIYNLKSKTEMAKWILANVIPQDLRTIIFCGSKDQADQVCPHRYYSKPTPPKKLSGKPTPKQQEKYDKQMEEYRAKLNDYQKSDSFNAFMEEKINRLACVSALNEGQNIPNLDVGFVIQLDSNELNLVQRMGRVLRYRPGHMGKIIILCVADTADKDWTTKSTINLDFANTRVVELSKLIAGTDTITF